MNLWFWIKNFSNFLFKDFPKKKTFNQSLRSLNWCTLKAIFVITLFMMDRLWYFGNTLLSRSLSQIYRTQNEKQFCAVDQISSTLYYGFIFAHLLVLYFSMYQLHIKYIPQAPVWHSDIGQNSEGWET